ncbi:MAG: hypothetical protein GY874_01835 [Desulfobacteraceae bacterium]|nr:hypothetical protein [Desulfobacteraceae bacterium]
MDPGPALVDDIMKHLSVANLMLIRDLVAMLVLSHLAVVTDLMVRVSEKGSKNKKIRENDRGNGRGNVQNVSVSGKPVIEQKWNV